jgi:hypothetical protein
MIKIQVLHGTWVNGLDDEVGIDILN